MTAIETIRELIREGGGSVRTADVTAAGISRTTLAKLTRQGALFRVARGQYIMPDVLPDELYLWQQRAAMLVYSHETALFLLGMAERVPGRQSATLPSDARLSQTFPGDLKLYFVKPELFGIGVSRLPTKMGHTVRAYNAERTLCDVLRSRSRMDDQTVAFALKCYVARNEKDLNLLGEYAALFHVTKALRAYLEVLL